jgi:tRNA (pseudouridine54-N1)-methyltransferase
LTIIFIIYSATVDIDNFTLKDIPGSSGRLDVVSRCILASLVGKNEFDEDVQVWVFLDKYGTYIFDSNILNYDTFPKNELMFTDHFVDLIRNRYSRNNLEINPLRLVSTSEKEVSDVLKELLKLNYNAYILHENGEDFFKNLSAFTQEKKVIFIVGNQSGDIMNLEEVTTLNLPRVSLGKQSYLASSVIRLIKLNLLTNVQ